MSETDEKAEREAAGPARTGSDEASSDPGEAERRDAKSGKIPDAAEPPREIGGPPGPEPTRYGDWEKKGRCIDF